MLQHPICKVHHYVVCEKRFHYAAWAGLELVVLMLRARILVSTTVPSFQILLKIQGRGCSSVCVMLA